MKTNQLQPKLTLEEARDLMKKLEPIFDQLEAEGIHYIEPYTNEESLCPQDWD